MSDCLPLRFKRTHHPAFAIGFGVTFLLTWLLPATGNGGPLQTSDQRLLEMTIEQLDSPCFSDRELATRSLGTMGVPAVKPLAIKVLTGSPEATWRAKQALEAIGTQGDEAVFLKTARVLQLLFPGENESFNQRLAELHFQWRLEQKKSILNQLRSKGAGIVDPMDIEGQAFSRPRLDLYSDQPVAVSPPQGNSGPKLKQSTEQALDQLEEILDASADANRDRLFAPRTPTAVRQASRTEALADIDPELLIEIELQRRMAAAAGGHFLAGGQFSLSGNENVTVVLDHQWQGNEHDLIRLQHLSDVTRIEFRNIDPAPLQLEAISQIPSIISVQIIGDEFNPQHLTWLARLANLHRIEFEEYTIRPATLEPLLEVPSLTAIGFMRCQISKTSLESLEGLTELRWISFADMQIDADVLLELRHFKNLVSVSMELCRFPTAAYRKLKTLKPGIRLDFTPRAVLGVRSALAGLGPTESDCEISQVVPGSGADKGGLKPGDIIKSVEGQAIEVFEDLRLHVAQHQAGDVLTVGILRGEKELTLEITLTPFESAQ